jgi:hypothetical protein
MLYILYPSGSHGGFLKLLINTMTGVLADELQGMIYDQTRYKKLVNVEILHLPNTHVNSARVINIRVRPESYLKYFAVCLNRTAGHNIKIEDLHIDTFAKIQLHSIISHFVSSLQTIVGQYFVRVEPMHLREWFRLCFFANQGETITKFIQPNVLPNAGYVVDFESFYDGSIVDICKDICSWADLQIINHTVDQCLDHFTNNNLYHKIDFEIPDIINAIAHKHNRDLSRLNLLQQAWIDNYLVTQYNVDPLLRNDYFLNTKDLITTYRL